MVAGITVSQDVVVAFPELEPVQLRERRLKEDGEGALSLRSDKGWYLTAFRVEPFIERPTRARRLIGSVTPSDPASCQDNS